MNTCLDYKSDYIKKLAEAVGRTATPAFADKVGTLMDKLGLQSVIQGADIYNNLGDKTRSDNVNIVQWKDIKDEKEPFLKAYGYISHVISTRIPGSDKHFGNPFTPDPKGKMAGLTEVSSTKEAVEKYIDWVISSTDDRAVWIREQLTSGELKGMPILYYKELGEPSHATALDYLINKYNWGKVSQPQPQLPTSDTKINIYAGTGENAELSNFANRPFSSELTNNEVFNTVEGAFQACKLMYTKGYFNEEGLLNDKGQALWNQLKTATGAQAKSLGRSITNLNTTEWDKASGSLMLALLRESFTQNKSAKDKLLATGNATLTHTQDKGKWGKEFPKLLMEVRDELKENTQQPQLPTIEQLSEYLNTNKPSESIEIKDGKAKVKPQGLSHAEVMLPAWTKKFFAKEFQDKNGDVDFKAINDMLPEVMDMIGYRIPTEDKYSMLPLKVVGFLPSGSGGAIMLPAEITTIAGSDFDVDKMYVMFKNIVKSRNKAAKKASKSIEIKPGVSELFESNPKLANAVYEAAGVKSEKTIETAKGSTYKYLPSGKTQRFKKVEGKEYEPQDILTFVPNYEWIKSNNPQWLETQGLENDTQYTQYLLEKVQGKDKVWIVDSKGKKIETNQEAKTADRLFIAFGKKDGSVEDFIPVSKEPVIGFYTYDSRIHFDEKGERYRDRHLGNKVVKITEGITTQQKQQAQQLYAQYLDTIFPDSKVKDIVYHGSKNKFDKFDYAYLPKADAGFYFTKDKKYAENFGNPLSAILNVKTPNYTEQPLSIETVERLLTTDYIEGTDTIIGKDAILDLPQSNADVIVTIRPSQIHILGSKQDIEGFSKFVKEQESTEESTTTQYEVEQYLDNSNSTQEERKAAYTKRMPEANEVRIKYKEKIEAIKEKIDRSMAVHKGQLAKLIEKKELQESEIQELFDARNELSLHRKALQDEWDDVTEEYQTSLEPRPEDVVIFKMMGVDITTQEYKEQIESEYNKLTEDIKSTDKIISELSDKIKSLSSEKIKKDDIQAKSDRKYAKLQELIAEKDALREQRDKDIYNLISDEEFAAIPIPEQNTKTARDNAIIDVHRGVLQNPSTVEAIFTPGGYDYLKDVIADKIGKLVNKGKKAANIFDANDVDLMTVQNTAGRDLKGIAASHNKFRGLMQHSNMMLVKGVRFNGVELRDLSGKSVNQKSTDGRSISRNVSEPLAAAVDNGKDPILASLGYNEHTAETIFMLLAVGVSPMTVYAFINQKPIRDALKEVELGNQRSLESALKDAYYKITGNYFNVKDTGIKNFDEGMLLSGINNDSKIHSANVIETMLHYLEISKSLNKVIMATKADTKGIGKYVEEGITALDMIMDAKDEKVAKHISGVVDFLEGNDNNKFTKSFTEYGIEKPIMDVFNEIYPYANDFFTSIKNRIKEFAAFTPSAEDNRKIDSQIVQYLMSQSTFYNSENAEIIVKTMPKTFLRLKEQFKEQLKGNKLFDVLSVENIGRKYKFDIVKFDNNLSASPEQREGIQKAWKELASSDIPELREFAENLVRYSFYITGHNFTPKSISSLIPMDYYLSINDGELSKIGHSIMDSVSLGNIYINDFISQFYRHNYQNTKFVPMVKEDSDNVTIAGIEIATNKIKDGTSTEPESQFGIKENGEFYPVDFITFSKNGDVRLYEFNRINSQGLYFYRITNKMGVKDQIFEYREGASESYISENNLTKDELDAIDRANKCNI